MPSKTFYQTTNRTSIHGALVFLAIINSVQCQSINQPNNPTTNQTNSNIPSKPCICDGDNQSNNHCCPAALGSTLALAFVCVVSVLMIVCCCWKIINRLLSNNGPINPSNNQPVKQSRWRCWRNRKQRQVSLWLHAEDQATTPSSDQSTNNSIEMTVLSIDSSSSQSITNSPSLSTRQPIDQYPASNKHVLFRGHYTINNPSSSPIYQPINEIAFYLKFDYHSNPRSITGYGFDRSNQLNFQVLSQSINPSIDQTRFEVCDGIFTISPETGEHKFQITIRFSSTSPALKFVMLGSWAGQSFNHPINQPIYLSNMRWAGQFVNESTDPSISYSGRFLLEPDREAIQRLIDEVAEKPEIVTI